MATQPSSNVQTIATIQGAAPAPVEQDHFLRQSLYLQQLTAEAAALQIAGTSSAKDNGPAWTTSRGISGARFTSADQSASFASVTDAPATGENLCITDLLISSDTALRLDFAVEDATATIIETVYMGANETKQITPRGKWKLATADKKLQVQASAAGNISITPFYYSEA